VLVDGSLVRRHVTDQIGPAVINRNCCVSTAIINKNIRTDHHRAKISVAAVDTLGDSLIGLRNSQSHTDLGLYRYSYRARNRGSISPHTYCYSPRLDNDTMEARDNLEVVESFCALPFVPQSLECPVCWKSRDLDQTGQVLQFPTFPMSSRYWKSKARNRDYRLEKHHQQVAAEWRKDFVT